MATRQPGKKKNLAFESLDIDLKKEADISAGKEAVGTEQPPKTTKAKAPQKPTKKPTTVKPKKAQTPVKEEKKEEMIRLTVDLPKSEHRALKILAMHADMKLYEYVYNIIKRHMDKQ